MGQGLLRARLGVILTLCWSGLAGATNDFQPEQIHISYGVDPSEMVVTWSTRQRAVAPAALYGRSSAAMEQHAAAITRQFVDGGVLQRRQFIYHATLTKLKPAHKYFYQVGSGGGWSEVFWFTAMLNSSSWSPRLAMFGDLGSENAQSLPRLQRETQMGLYDAVIHVGDFAYDMNWRNGEVGDEFMRQIQPIAAYLPYMTCPGNHEEKYNFSNYKHRFNMPADVASGHMFYSWNMGPVHFISVSSEYYYFLNYGLKMAAKQYHWLVSDLLEANSAVNRSLRPWIVLYAHRPMYCTNTDHDDCTHLYDAFRVGLPVIHAFGVEELLWRYGVDLAVWAHEHSYERLWPVYDGRVYNGSAHQPYTNPGATVHITTGSAGCRERHDYFMNSTRQLSAFRSSDYGYTRLHAVNYTHLYLEQVSDDQNGAVIDHIWIQKDVHKPFDQLHLTSSGYL